MIICLCWAVSEDVIKDCIRRGYNVDEIKRRTMAGTGCGTCLETILNLIEEELNGNQHEGPDEASD